MYPYCVGSDLEPDGTECDGGSPVRGLEEDDQQVFSENDVIRYTVQLLEALQFLHSHNILHLDIKVSQSGSQLSSTGAQIRLKSASHQPWLTNNFHHIISISQQDCSYQDEALNVPTAF